MTGKIIKYSFEPPSLEDLARDAEDRPLFTQISHGLQAANQMTLWELYLRSGLPLPKGAILDAGGGDGLFLALAPEMVFKMQEIRRRTIILVDLDKNKVSKARRAAELVTESFRKRTTNVRPEGLSLVYLVQDPQDLAQMDTDYVTINGEKTHFPQIAMVWSNSMFHWIKEPKDKYSALARFHRVLKEGGILCMSMSTGGTARDFLEAYFSVMQSLGPYSVFNNPAGYRRAEFERDPIGSRPLDEIVSMVEESGFDVAIALAVGESVTYANPREYSNAVKIYGMDAFLNPVSHISNERKQRLWRTMEESFLDRLRKSGWQDNQPYTYNQFNSYIVAKKRPVPEHIKSTGGFRSPNALVG